MRLILLFACLILFARPCSADLCKDPNFVGLRVSETKSLPKPNIKRTVYKTTKKWFAQETHEQAPDKLNYDTTVTATSDNGKLVQILAQGHAREHGVTTKWVDERSLSIDVEWGHAVFCKYRVDLANQKSVLLN